MANIRKPNVAGQFYPGQVEVLTAMMDQFLTETNVIDIKQPKAIIAPHAGYVYSGPIAATVYATLLQYKKNIKNILLLGPAHSMYFKGVAITEVDYFETPLGSIPVSHNWRDLLSIPAVEVNELAYNMEHSLEVQLPFLQVVLGDFKLLPLVVGDVHFDVVAEVLAHLWGESDTLVVISSDLSHYYDYTTAQEVDAATSDAIINLQPEKISAEQACGRTAIQGLLKVAKQYKLTVRALDVRNSGDTAGSKDSVVGYGAYCFWENINI